MDIIDEVDALIEELKDHGISQNKVAAYLGITPRGLSYVLNGQRSGEVMFRPTGEKMQKLRALVSYVRQAKEQARNRPQQQPARAMIVSQPAPAPVRQTYQQPRIVEARPVQIIQTPAPPPTKRPSRRYLPDLLPQHAASMYPEQAPIEVVAGPAIAYHAHYRPETWPVWVPVNPPPELKVKLAWPRSPDRGRWDQ